MQNSFRKSHDLVLKKYTLTWDDKDELKKRNFYYFIFKTNEATNTIFKNVNRHLKFK